MAWFGVRILGLVALLALAPLRLFAQTFETLGAVTASSTGTAVAAGNNAKGSYVQLTASSGLATKTLYLYLLPSGTSTTGSYAIDVATGAALSEVVVIPDVYLDAGGAGNGRWTQYVFRIDIASATRIAVRAEGPTVAGTEEVTAIIILCDTELPALTSPAGVSYGVTLGGDIKGVAYDTGGTAHTKAGYTQITSGASATLQHLHFILGRNGNGALTDAGGLIDVATGGAGSETVKIANIPFGSVAAADAFLPRVLGPFPGAFAQSARVSVNAQLSIIDATDRVFTVAAGGVTGTVPGGGSGGILQLNKRGGKQQ